MIGEQTPNYLILKYPNKNFELYFSNIGLTTVGNWDIRSDTLFFSPSFEYTSTTGHISYLDADSIQTDSSVEHKYLIKDNGKRLVDVTDYGSICPELSNGIDFTYEVFRLRE